MNPWKKISASEYEGHMSDPSVVQLQELNKIFKRTIEEYNPCSICVLGSATGNGFEHLIGKEIKKVVGIEVNREFVEVCKNRFATKLPMMELICSDLNDVKLPQSSFDLIYGALIFEYVDIEKTLNHTLQWLKPGGIFGVVLQIASQISEPVSETRFESLKSLSTIIKLVEPKEFARFAEKHGLIKLKSYEVDLQRGKKFFVSYFKKR